MAETPISQSNSKATPLQLALDIFSDLSANDLPLAESTREIGFVRSNLFATINGLSLTARRIVDAAYFIAAQEGQARDVYDVDFSYFRWLMRYDSRNLAHLRQRIIEAQRALVEVTDTPLDRAPTEDDKWSSVHLLGDVEIVRGRIQLCVSEKILRHIIQPYQSHWLSLRISTALTLAMARAIYDRLLLYGQGGVTEWYALEDILSWPGKIGKSAGEFKVFRSRYLEPAAEQINQLTDFDISWDSRVDRDSHRTSHIRFRAVRKQGSEAAKAGLPPSMYGTLRDELGLEAEDFEAIALRRAEWTDAHLERAIEFTQFKLSQGKITRSARGFFMKALAEGWKVSGADRIIAENQERHQQERERARMAQEAAQQEVRSSEAAADAAQNARIRQDRMQGAAWIEGADERVQTDLLRAFLAAPLYGKRALSRAGVHADQVTLDSVRHLQSIWASFCDYAYSKLKKTRAVS
ncbi:replication initiation protein [Paraburkholderia humisilvae]|uniref:Initiator Rep protein WH1 domain-containing protein n=1 Tax=Paraburkholderia humisilvae TaxID=627669 RepID=A0A6J5F5W5_9BURK|nr:replication initiation protein [Paraburkholderia humisilvae]CAB3774189.1 hypothetical protein LMG29542_07637 [Paraburkholderia humisilvae]